MEGRTDGQRATELQCTCVTYHCWVHEEGKVGSVSRCVKMKEGETDCDRVNGKNKLLRWLNKGKEERGKRKGQMNGKKRGRAIGNTGRGREGGCWDGKWIGLLVGEVDFLCQGVSTHHPVLDDRGVLRPQYILNRWGMISLSDVLAYEWMSEFYEPLFPSVECFEFSLTFAMPPPHFSPLDIASLGVPGNSNLLNASQPMLYERTYHMDFKVGRANSSSRREATYPHVRSPGLGMYPICTSKRANLSLGFE